MQRHVIEVLYLDRCPFLVSVIDRVRRAVQGAVIERDADIEIRLVRVAEIPQSPLVRVDGRVVDVHRLDVVLGGRPASLGPRPAFIV